MNIIDLHHNATRLAAASKLVARDLLNRRNLAEMAMLDDVAGAWSSRIIWSHDLAEHGAPARITFATAEYDVRDAGRMIAAVTRRAVKRGITPSQAVESMLADAFGVVNYRSEVADRALRVLGECLDFIAEERRLGSYEVA